MSRSAYIHVPFCTHRCGYCNFTLVAGRADLVPTYLDALERELKRLSEPRSVATIFIGGGTPTFLERDSLQRLLDLVNHWFPRSTSVSPKRMSETQSISFDHDPHRVSEYSVEANPNDITDEIVAQLKAGGVTRVSLGAQSMNAAKLKLLERDHDAAQIAFAVQSAKKHGLQVGVDLIFGAPGETLAEWQSDLREVVALDPHHVSTYGLTWEKGTQFWNRKLHGELQQVPEEIEQSMYEASLEFLSASGYEHYEISNFAKPGFRSRHNEAYWLGEEYYAAGPGAARYIDGVRSSNHRSTTAWIAKILAGDSPIADQEQLSAIDRARELLVFALRRIEGVNRTWFAAKSGIELDALVGQRIETLCRMDLLVDQGDAIRLSRRGIMVADGVCSELLKT